MVKTNKVYHYYVFDCACVFAGFEMLEVEHRDSHIRQGLGQYLE